VIIPEGPPDNEWARTVCKIGEGHACCRYLTMGRGGWSCAKQTSFKAHLDRRVERGDMRARGDNCDGRSS
jgi:hypothetical protein